MSETVWHPIIDGRIDSNAEFVLVLMPRYTPSGRIQSCKIRDGKPFVIGGIFAWDYGKEQPTHWTPYPNLPAGE